MKKGTYTTEAGKTLTILPGSPYQVENYRLAFTEQFEKNHPRPAKPTYQMQTAGGGFETQEHDETTLETDEDKAAWQAWKGYNDALDAFVNTKLLDMLIIEYVEVEPQKDNGWLKKKKFLGVTVPDDELELKLYYVREHLIIDQENGGDFARLPVAIMQLSGMTSRAVGAANATFRRSLRRGGRQNARPTDAERAGQMVDEPAFSGVEDGEGVGLDS